MLMIVHTALCRVSCCPQSVADRFEKFFPVGTLDYKLDIPKDGL